MVAKKKWLAQNNRAVDTRAKAMANALNLWLLRYAKDASKKAAKIIPKDIIRAKPAKVAGKMFKISNIAKADGNPFTDKREAELFELYYKYGILQLNESGKKGAKLVDGQWILYPEIRRKFIDQIAEKVRLVIAETEKQIKESLRVLIAEAQKEVPTPSSREIARRIARQWHGPEESRESLFSFERAERIARTELNQFQNQGIAESMGQAGVKRVKWLAHSNDGRSGDRQHYRMNQHKAITVDAMQGRDSSEWFKLPDGTRMPYPGYSGAPIKHLANCRCTIVPA